MSRSKFAIRCTKNAQKSTEPLFLLYYGPCKYHFVESCLDFVCAFTSLLWGIFCSRSECEKGKAIWDACVAEIKQDPGQTKHFDTQMLAVMDQMGQYTQTD
jgi:hypothetical protein